MLFVSLHRFCKNQKQTTVIARIKTAAKFNPEAYFLWGGNRVCVCIWLSLESIGTEKKNQRKCIYRLKKRSASKMYDNIIFVVAIVADNRTSFKLIKVNQLIDIMRTTMCQALCTVFKRRENPTELTQWIVYEKLIDK